MEFDNWRQQSAKLPAEKITEVYFTNSKKPNVFWIKNLSDSDLYVSTSFMPSAKSYHKRILSFSDEIVATPRATDRIFIYNSSKTNAEIDVYSDKISIFDFMLLKKNTDCVIQGAKQDFTLSVSDSALKSCLDGTSLRVSQTKSDIILGTATTVTTVGDVSNIHVIANDSGSPVTVSINDTEFILKAGEVINDIYNVNAKNLVIGKNDETVNCRYFCST